MPSLEHIEVLERSEVKFSYYLAVLHHWLSGPSFADIHERFGVNEAECAVVFTTALRPGLTATDICQITGRSKNAISRAVNSTARRRLITRKSEHRDKRRVLLGLTATGWRLHERMVPIFLARQDELLSHLSEQELRTLEGLLRKLLGNVVGWADLY